MNIQLNVDVTKMISCVMVGKTINLNVFHDFEENYMILIILYNGKRCI